MSVLPDTILVSELLRPSPNPALIVPENARLRSDSPIP